MPNVSLAAAFRGVALISFSWMAIIPVSGQVPSERLSDLSRVFDYSSSRGIVHIEESTWSFPDSPAHASIGPATVSSDILRHPLTSKARKRLEKALHLSRLGEHLAAIRELRETLVKEPSSAPYTQNLLGMEYAENNQLAEARSSFEEAVRLMPHESANHSNLGYSLAVAGDLNSAELEARKAIKLDPTNTRAKSLLDVLIHSRRTKER